MKNFHRTLRISATVGFILALCCLACTVYAKDDGKDKDRNHGIGYEAHINYPIFEKETILNTQVSDVVRKALEAFNSEFFSAEASAYPQSVAFDIDSGSVYEDATHISFLLTVYQYTGGAAHGTTTLIPITYSKQTKKLLSLEEALQPTKKDWLAALSTEARKQLKDQVQKKTFTSDEDWINRGTEPTQENFEVFKLEKNSVRIIFSQYQVGPYSSGMPEIVVPRSLFK